MSQFNKAYYKLSEKISQMKLLILSDDEAEEDDEEEEGGNGSQSEDEDDERKPIVNLEASTYHKNRKILSKAEQEL